MTDSTPIVPFGGLHGSGNDKPQFEIIAALKRDLAAAQERAEQNAKDAEFGKILMRYIDRLIDPVPSDPLEKIVGEMSAAIDAAMKEGK